MDAAATAYGIAGVAAPEGLGSLPANVLAAVEAMETLRLGISGAAGWRGAALGIPGIGDLLKK